MEIEDILMLRWKIFFKIVWYCQYTRRILRDIVVVDELHPRWASHDHTQKAIFKSIHLLRKKARILLSMLKLSIYFKSHTL